VVITRVEGRRSSASCEVSRHPREGFQKLLRLSCQERERMLSKERRTLGAKQTLQPKHTKQKRPCCGTILGGYSTLPTRSPISKAEHVKQIISMNTAYTSSPQTTCEFHQQRSAPDEEKHGKAEKGGHKEDKESKGGTRAGHGNIASQAGEQFAARGFCNDQAVIRLDWGMALCERSTLTDASS
jgi:hypothetical protein